METVYKKSILARFPRSRAWRGDRLAAVCGVIGQEFADQMARLKERQSLSAVLFGLSDERLETTEKLLHVPPVGGLADRKARILRIWYANRQQAFDDYGSLSPMALQKELELIGFSGLTVHRGTPLGAMSGVLCWGRGAFGSFQFQAGVPGVSIPSGDKELVMDYVDPEKDAAIASRVTGTASIMRRSFYVGGASLVARPQIPLGWKKLLRTTILRNKELGVPVWLMVDFI